MTGHVERAKRWCLQAKTPAFFAGLRAGQEGGGGGGREGRTVGGEMRTSAQGAGMVSALSLDRAKAPRTRGWWAPNGLLRRWAHVARVCCC